MSYSTRSKKKLMGEGGPAGDMGNELIKQKPKVDKHFEPPIANASKEDKTNLKSHSEGKTAIAKTSNANELGNVNHNLDVFNQSIQEDPGSFNEKTILVLDMWNGVKFHQSKNEYAVICKIGYGGFSIVWLVMDMKTHEFKVAKVFKYKNGITSLEIKTLQQTANHPNILHFYEHISIKTDIDIAAVAIYEPLGKDLNMLMKEAAKHGGLPISIVKKVANHVLSALKTIHDLKIVHSDIKLQNIATCVSQLSLCRQLENFAESGKSLTSFRMVCQKNAEFDESINRKILKRELGKVKKMDNNETSELIFKLIDFGNAMEEGTESTTGTYGFRPPEYFFRSPMLPSHDIWSLGVSIVVLLTNKRFIEHRKSKKAEIKALRNMFGKFSRHHFKCFKDPKHYKKKFTTRFYNCKLAKAQRRRMLQKKVSKVQMLQNDRNGLIHFLSQMLNTIPSKRKSAAELLSHPWLKVISEREPISNGELNLSQKFSDASKTQRLKQTSPNEIGTPVESVAVLSPSNNNGTCGILMDERSIEEQMDCESHLKPLTSTDTKHSKNGGELTEKTKKATKNIRRYDSFIYKENDDRYYLYHKYWRIPYREDNDLFECPKCKRSIRFERKIGFVMVSDKNWHKDNKCLIKGTSAPKKGHRYRVFFKLPNREKMSYRDEVITKEEIDDRRKSLENKGYKPILDPIILDANCQKDAEMSEDDDYNYDVSSDETEYGTDSDLDETEEDSNKTLSEFESGESYVELDASNAPPRERISYEFGELIDPQLFDISLDKLEISSNEALD